jgi:transcriptional regulator GlxA family with amidase domain
VRSLQAGFQQHVGRSPMALLKDVRMKGAHEELLQAHGANGGVGQVALRWGFMHLGQFAMDYKLRFGELPSETTRRTLRQT